MVGFNLDEFRSKVRNKLIVALVAGDDVEIRCPGGPVKGRITDYDDDGYLVVEDVEGRTILIPKDKIDRIIITPRSSP